MAFAYPPLQPALVAAVSRPFGVGYATARAVSIAGYLLALLCAYGFLRDVRTPRTIALGGLALSAAAFAPTGAWYDLVRIDSLWLGLVTAGLWAAWRARASYPAAVVAGVLLTASLFTKQTAAPFIGIAVLGLLRGAPAPRPGRWAATVAAVTAVAIVLLQARDRRLVLAVRLRPASAERLRHLAGVRAGAAAGRAAAGPGPGPGAARAPLRHAGARSSRTRGRSDGALLATLAIFGAAMVATIRGAGPPWGYFNAFIPALFFGGILLAVAAAASSRRTCRRRPRPRCSPSPWPPPPAGSSGPPTVPGRRPASPFPSATIRAPSSPPPRTAVSATCWSHACRSAHGPVFVPFHPSYARYAGKTPTLHAQNLADINAIPDLGTPKELIEAIRNKAFALVVLDVEGDGPAAEAEAMGQFPRLAGHYEIVERIEGPRVVSGAPVRPRLVLVPKP